MPLRIIPSTTIDLSPRCLLLNQLVATNAAGYDVTCNSAVGPNVNFLQAHGLRHVAMPTTRGFIPTAGPYCVDAPPPHDTPGTLFSLFTPIRPSVAWHFDHD